MSQPPRNQEPRKACVLIVDDSAESIRLLSGILQDEYRVIIAKDGEKALERAAAESPPDLVLLDVMMPGMDGYAVCRRLKADPHTRDIPVIFSTIRDDQRDETEGFDAGAVDYIGKPVQAEIVRARVRTHIELKRHRDHLEELVRERTTELEQANREKESALRTKNEFLSCVTHELRTPMSGVIGISDVMLHRSDDPDHQRLLEIIRSSATAQMRLIDDILDFARLELGKGRLKIGELSIANVVQTISDMFQPEVQEKELQLVSHIADDIPITLWGDVRLLRQTLMNLTGNAIKFTASGSVEISVTSVERSDDELRLRVDIIDTGIGIAADKKELIFEGFAQADSSSTRRYPGLGLGLSTAKHMVELMDGEIGLESPTQGGSHFWFTTSLRQRPPLD